jgi:hypothetical protein
MKRYYIIFTFGPATSVEGHINIAGEYERNKNIRLDTCGTCFSESSILLMTQLI